MRGGEELAQSAPPAAAQRGQSQSAGSTGRNPYDSVPVAPAREPKGVRREGSRTPVVRNNDPYTSADRGRGQGRSWDDAFIDTWVEHDSKR